MCDTLETSGRFWIALTLVFKLSPFVPSPPSRESQVKGGLCEGHAFFKVFLKQTDQTQLLHSPPLPSVLLRAPRAKPFLFL